MFTGKNMRKPPPKDSRDLPAVTFPFYAPLSTVAGLNNEFNQHGEILRIRGLPVKPFCFRHPDHLKEIYTHEAIGTRKQPRLLPRVQRIMGKGTFIHEGGDDWRRRRKVAQPSFTRHASWNLADSVPEIMEDWLKRWDRYAETGETFVAQSEFGKLIIDITLRILFSKKLSLEALTAVHEDTDCLLRVFSSRAPVWLPIPDNFRYRKAVANMQRFMRELIEERLANPTAHTDLLTTLLNGEDAQTGRRWTVREVQDEMFSIYFGATIVRVGFLWMFYLLSRYPEARRRLEEEIERVLPDAPPGAETLESLSWPLMIFEEATRLYPPVWGFPRYAGKPVEIGGCRFPAGSVLLPIGYLAHRHPDFWENADGFDPLRFAPETRGKLHPFAYYPFGGGPRMCLGRNLAPLICQQVLIMTARRYHFDFVSHYPDEPTLSFAFELSPRHSMNMAVKRRQAKGAQRQGVERFQAEHA